MKEKKFELPSFNKKAITILTFIIYALTMVTFEIFYCNASTLRELITTQNNGISYNFSLCRIVMYIAIFIAVYFIKDKIIDQALECFENNKYKKIFTYLYLILATLTLIGAYIIVFIKPELSRGMSIGIIACLMGAIFIIYVSKDVAKNAVLLTLTLGAVFSISANFNHAIDEKKHFMTAFNIACGNFDYAKNPITDKQIEELPQLSKFSTIDPFLEKKYEPNITDEVNKEDTPSTPAEYNFVTYLAPALGIAIAKLLGGSIIDLYIMGRIFNLILYAVFIFIAIKLIPYKKNIFAIIFLMPMSLILAATYSIDGFCIGSVAIFIAYCLKLHKENETINLKEFAILVGLFLLMLCGKSMAYILVGFMVFILPIKETLKKNKKYWPIMIVAAILALILMFFGVMYVKKSHIKEDTRAGNNISVSGQIDSIIHNPILDLKVAFNHINNTILRFDWYNMLHDSKFFTNYCQAVLIPLLLFILYVSLTEVDHNFKLKNKIVMYLSFLLVFAMTSLVLYLSFSPVGSLNIGGYQTRYILPILPLVLFGISNKNIMLKDIKNRNFNIAIASGIFVMLGIMQNIIVQ